MKKRLFALILAVMLLFSCGCAEILDILESAEKKENAEASAKREEITESIEEEVKQESKEEDKTEKDVPDTEKTEEKEEDMDPASEEGDVQDNTHDGTEKEETDDTDELLKYLDDMMQLDYPYVFTPQFEVEKDGKTYQVMLDELYRGDDGYQIAVVSDGSDYYEADSSLWYGLKKKEGYTDPALEDRIKGLLIVTSGEDEEEAKGEMVNDIIPGVISEMTGGGKAEIEYFSEIRVNGDSLIYRPVVMRVDYSKGEEFSSVLCYLFVIPDPQGTRVYLFGIEPNGKDMDIEGSMRSFAIESEYPITANG